MSEEALQSGVGVSNLSVVETAFVLCGVRFRGLVGVVGIVQVNPFEMGAGGVGIAPGFSSSNYVWGAAFEAPPSGLGVRMLGKIVVVVETSIQPGRKGSSVKHDRADECRRGVS